MKRITMVLPFAIMLAYCSGPNNTQTTTDMDMEGTSASVTASTTGTTDGTVTDASDVSTSSSDVAASSTTAEATTDGTLGHRQDIGTTNSSNYGSISTTGTVTLDPSDPMNQHFQRVNGSAWTWDMDYPGFDRPTAGSYNSAINGNWQLVMTPELVSAWRQDNSRDLWSSGYAYDGRYLGGSTYLSASESFNTRNDASLNTQGSLDVNASGSAGTLSSSTTAGTHGLNNNASSNSSVANQMNGSTNSSVTNNNANPSLSGSAGGSVVTNGGTTIQNSTSTEATLGTGTVNGTVNGSATTNSNVTNNNANPSLSGSAGGSVITNGGTTIQNNTTTDATTVNSGLNGTISGSTDLNGTTSVNSNMDVNSINYNAANGNMYQLPKFNLYLDNGSFTGYTGCNTISGRVSVSGTSLQFQNTTPATNIDCLGGLDQTAFLDMLRRIDSYSYVGDELHLMQGNQVLLRFKRGDSNTSLQ